jgi:putative ergosteryl-3beta-O-L-aspartate hydrolase
MESRFGLRVKAAWWRAGQRAGMALHRFANPAPPVHSEKHTIRTTLSTHAGELDIYLYYPKNYQLRTSGKRFPLLINFHGGGFTLGYGTDDCRWFGAVMEMTDAIIATVDYRLAPEYPFPTAVEDGADAVLWLISQANNLAIDLERGIAISGFSAGANLAFTVPLKLDQLGSTDDMRITAIVSWYPPTDYTISRAERNKTNVKPEAGLPRCLTSLFDQAYLFPPGCETDILVSPALATDEQLIRALPRDIWIYTCEYDDLCDEGRKFAERLSDLGKTKSHHEQLEPISTAHSDEGEPSIKRVRYNMIPGVPHAWDKAPNPLLVNEIARATYHQAVVGLKELWERSEP